MKLLMIADEIGKKLWPLTSSEVPKALLPIYSNHSQLHETLSRSVPVLVPTNGKDIFVVVTEDSIEHLINSKLMDDFGIPTSNIIGVPSSRGSAVALTLACQYMLLSGACTKDEQIAFMPTDQFFWPLSTYVFHYYNMVDYAKLNIKRLSMLGLEPAGITSVHNYISGDWEESKAVGVPMITSNQVTISTLQAKAIAYNIKPDLKLVGSLIEKNALWDLGHYIWNTGDIIDYIDQALTDKHRAVINACFNVSSNGSVYIDTLSVEAEWNKLSSVSFSDDVLSIIVEAGYADVMLMSYVIWATLDNWISIKHLLYDSNLYQPQQLPNIHLVDSQRNLIFKPPNKEVAIFGVSDLIIIDTGEKLLVGTPGGIYEHF